MKQLNLPEYPFRLRKRESRNEIFDEVRKKWLVCTPEEWVRQHFVRWLITSKGYLASNIALEGGLKLNQLQKRTDIVCYKSGLPLLLVECKAPSIFINQKTFDQLFRYNQKVNAPYMAVTNGLTHVFAKQNSNSPIFLPELPLYSDSI